MLVNIYDSLFFQAFFHWYKHFSIDILSWLVYVGVASLFFLNICSSTCWVLGNPFYLFFKWKKNDVIHLIFSDV